MLSVMAVKVPYTFVGTSPDAAYWLLRCEDETGESLAEEDYWAAAAEFADSVGVDIISSSLGFMISTTARSIINMLSSTAIRH